MTQPSANSEKAYAASGVDIDLGNRLKSGIQKRIQSATRKEVLSKIGGFGGLFDARFKGLKKPVLVSSIDGVGTKLKVAAMAGRHDTIGMDLVNHCVNDIAVTGAEPLFFLDYIGTSKLDPAVFGQILGGLSKACREAGCALIGGETAQMPGLYHGEDYDLVGTIIGVAERDKMIDGSRIRPGDVLVGFPSSGLHTNGYSLARQVIFSQLRMGLDEPLTGTRGSLGDALLAPHVNYQPLLKKLSKKVDFKGLAHITGGGFVDNIPRILPKNTDAEIHLGHWPVLPIFELLRSSGSISEEELYQVFNMGIGMVAVVKSSDAPKILASTKAYILGSVVKGRRRVRLVKA
jgi:phosphoribosylformylglycinamidine cyclo-ligase